MIGQFIWQLPTHKDMDTTGTFHLSQFFRNKYDDEMLAQLSASKDAYFQTFVRFKNIFTCLIQ